MLPPLELRRFCFNNYSIDLYVPDPVQIQESFLQKFRDNSFTPSPYWSQVWPAAIALSNFLIANYQYTHEKKVLELAAGLGLPSFVAATYAREVLCTDYLPEAIQVMNQSITHNKLNNVTTGLIDWNNIPSDITADVLLFSDINYEPASFDALYNVVQRFIEQGTTIILSTPQRIMGKHFIERLLPWCIHQEEVLMHDDVPTSVFVLQETAP